MPTETTRQIAHVIRTPAGRLSLVGSVPTHLAYHCESDEQAELIRQFGPGLFKVQPRSFETVEDASQAVEAAGGTFCGSPTCACRNVEPAS